MTKDMTTGAITPLLVKFTIPLVLGNLFQLTYNAADSIIVGKFVGEDALAAVGTSNPLMTLAILFINGLCLGAGILVSTAYGAGDTQRVERQVSTTAIAGTVFSLVFSALCVLLATPLLRLMQVPEEILPIAVQYLRIVFAGLIFTFFYNFLAATMRALGDSKSALYFLMISAVLNIGGDLFFVEVLAGAAKAAPSPPSSARRSAVCSASSISSSKFPSFSWGGAGSSLTALCCAAPSSTAGPVPCSRPPSSWARSPCRPSSTLWASTQWPLSPPPAGWTTSPICPAEHRPRYDHPDGSEHGAGKKERVRQGFFCGLRIELIYGFCLMTVCLLFARPIISLFVDDPAVIDLGVKFLRCASLFYLMPGVTNGIQGGFRGLGDLKITLNSSMLNMGFRVAAAAVLVLVLKVDLQIMPVSYGIGWLSMLVYELPLLIRYMKEDKL